MCNGAAYPVNKIWMDPAMSGFDPLLAQQKLMGPWCGRPLDDLGVLRVLNETGSKPPLFWICNAGHEPKTLAETLGDDQPLVFSRSAHLIVPPDQDQQPTRDTLTRYLAREVVRNFDGGAFDIGTSCQGASMVMNLARILPSQGVQVHHLCLINCAIPPVETHRPALLIYGDQDVAHDPFSTDPVAAKARADAAYSRYRRVVLPVGHGQFYSPAILPDILSQFAGFRDAPVSDRSVMAEASSPTVG